MTTDNREMWRELGIDLKQHDLLMNALPPVYKNMYLSRRIVPKGWNSLIRSGRYPRHQSAGVAPARQGWR